jgi:hypothetical protein
VRLTAPTLAAEGDPRGRLGGLRLFLALKGDLRARLSPSAALPGTLDPGCKEGPGRAPAS